MSIYTNPRSPYYWMYLERVGERGRGRGTRESTGIPVRAGSAVVARRNRQLADDLYAIRMGELARDALLKHQNMRTVTPALHPTPPPPPLADDGWCYIYFIQRGHMVKIGRTTNVTKRLEALGTASHETLTLRAAVPSHAALEGAIHKRFSGLKCAGEWFQLCDELEAFIEALNRGVNPVALLFQATTRLSLTSP